MRTASFHTLRFLLAILMAGICAFPAAVRAQLSPSLYSYPYHHLDWYTLESEHFLVHFQEGNSRSAQTVSRISEEVYPYLTELYGVEPDSKTSIVLKDREDYANGAAYFFDNQVDIWIPALDSPLRGTHDWLRNVISHEFTHLIQLEAAMKRSRNLPAIYLQWLSYEDVRRPDILYGYPKGLLTYPLSSIAVPGWFAEGVAQYQRTGWSYDTWDSHRDMLLRTSLLHDTYLDFEEMGTFSSKNGLEREQVYNQGFAFTSYLAQQYGETVFRDISSALSEAGTVTVGEAIRRATGTGGKELFEEWLKDRSRFYEQAVAGIAPSPGDTVAKEGYFNFSPRWSPDGSAIAYLSNRSLTESTVSLYLQDRTNGTRAGVIDLGAPGRFTDGNLSCGFSERPLIKKIRSAYSFSPDGQRLVYTVADLNEYGERYNDLYIFELGPGTRRQLTQSARLHDPAWGPDGERIAAIQLRRGTANLVRVDPETGSVEPLTGYTDGEQLYTPRWGPDGEWIYFALSEPNGRSIHRYEIATGRTQTLLHSPYFDYRDPVVGPEGLFLYFSADLDGIFNIYRIPLPPQGTGEPEQLTSVTGGAFMPDINRQGELLYAEYGKGGYRIMARRPGVAIPPSEWGRYAPTYPEDPLTEELYERPGPHDDSDLDPLEAVLMQRADTATVTLASVGETPRQLYRYRQQFTAFNLYPVVRFDNYSKFNGSNRSLLRAGDIGGLGENLLRDLKLGTYFSSREVINRLTLFGGALFGVGSRAADGIGDFFSPARLTDLDRDLFLITEYRGLPFIRKRWSPTVTLELYNMRRNVDSGLAIEEFPCTSCLPDTTRADIAYNIWEANLSFRSKLNDRTLLDLGVGYTPYRVQTDAFFSRELRQLIPSGSTEYYRGTKLTAAYIYESFLRYPHSDSAPLGLRTSLRYSYLPSKLLDSFEIEGGTLAPVYRADNHHTLELSARYGFQLGDAATGLAHTRLFSYLNNPSDSFYLDYIGGFTGMRSYPFFALSGNTTAYSQLSYIFPLARRLGYQAGRHTFDKLYLRLFGEVGNGWDGPAGTGSRLKTGLGAELRFSFNSYYLYPLKFFISGAYGFNEFDVTLPEEFLTRTGSGRVTYGKEPLIHFGLTFDFDILNHD